MLQRFIRTAQRTLAMSQCAAPTTRAALFSQSARVWAVSAQQLNDKLRAKFPESDLIDVNDARM